MKLTETHQTALQDVLKWRRDMRHFRPDPLPEAELDHLRIAMDSAPSVGNACPWRVFRVQNAGLRSEVRSDFERCNEAAADAYGESDRAAYLRLKLAGLDQAPEHLAIFTETAPAAGRGLGRRTMPQTLEQSTAMAIHALWLTARARNIGVGMLSIIDPERMCRLFGAPDTWRFSAYLCIGYPAFDDDKPLLHREGWQENSRTRWVIR